MNRVFDPEKRCYWTSDQVGIHPLCRFFPSISFYIKLARAITRTSRQARRGVLDWEKFSLVTLEVFQALESVGVKFEISGLQHLAKIQGGCVLVANHMSMLETMVLPAFLPDSMRCAFILKKDLLEYPIFKHILIAMRSIPVSRHNSRQDLKIVLEEGTTHLQEGTSIVVFPQTTRTVQFEPQQFNSIAIKLAKKANVPVVPIALRTDTWRNGKWVKDLGRVDPSLRAYFAFGEPLFVEGRGDREHQTVIRFIQEKLRAWGLPSQESQKERYHATF